MTEEVKRVTLYDEDVNPFELVVVATLKINDMEYAILFDEVEEEDYIFRMTKDEDGDDQFEMIDNEEEVQEVIDAYYELQDSED